MRVRKSNTTRNNPPTSFSVSATERLIGATEFSVAPSTLMLLRHTSGGLQSVDNPVATLSALLPISLKDIFFIDGDRALAFIEATDEQRVKRDRVARAVRALLGLDLLEDAERHVDKARQEAVSAIRRLGAGTDIERLACATSDELSALYELLSADEMDMLLDRAQELLGAPRFPYPASNHAYPWPMV